MILVTGATGNIGSLLLQRLVALKAPVRGLSRDPGAAATRFPRGVEWRPSDVSRDGLAAATAGIETLVLVTAAGPGMAEREAAYVDAAKASGVRRVVKLSGLGAGPEAPIRLAQAHYRSEQHILRAGLKSVFVRPNLFFQTLASAAAAIAGEGVIHAPAGDGHISFTDARDVADVIAAAATSAQHDGRAIEITGPQALSYTDVAAAIGQRIGRPVRHVDLTPEQQRQFLLSNGVDAWTTEAFVELFGIYRAGYGSGICSPAIEAVTGHPARALDDFLDEFVPALRATADAH